jgi:hypothetical protein
MPRTFIRQDLQIQPSQTYNAAMAAGTALQSGAQSLEDDLNGLRTQVSRVLDSSLGGNWYDDAYTTANGKKRSIKQLNTSLDTIETKQLLARVQNGANISVPAGQNYVVLSFATSQTPNANLAFGAATLGAVVAQSTTSAAPFSANELTAQAGSNAIAPKNLVRIRNSVGGQALRSTDLDIYGLLQVESTAVDGGAFSDTSATSRAKISFVTINYSTMTLQACPAADIGGKAFNYLYVLRQTLSSMPEQAFVSDGSFADNIGDLDVTLTRGTANQAGPVPVAQNIFWQVANGAAIKVQDAGGAHDLVAYVPATGNNQITFSPDGLTLNTTTAPISKKGLVVSQATQPVNLGTTLGQIDTLGPLSIVATGTNPLSLLAGTALNVKDGNQAGSTWATSGINLTGAAADWNTYKVNFGEVALLAGINAASSHGNHSKRFATVTATSIPSGTNVTGSGAGANIDAALFDYSSVISNFSSQVNVYVNGQLMRGGANAAAGHDCYPGTGPATGDLMFNFALKGTVGHADVVCMEVFALTAFPA